MSNKINPRVGRRFFSATYVFVHYDEVCVILEMGDSTWVGPIGYKQRKQRIISPKNPEKLTVEEMMDFLNNFDVNTCNVKDVVKEYERDDCK